MGAHGAIDYTPNIWSDNNLRGEKHAVFISISILFPLKTNEKNVLPQYGALFPINITNCKEL